MTQRCNPVLFAAGDSEISPTAKPRISANHLISVAVGDADVPAPLRGANDRNESEPRANAAGLISECPAGKADAILRRANHPPTEQ